MCWWGEGSGNKKTALAQETCLLYRRLHTFLSVCRNLGKYEAAYKHALETRLGALQRVQSILELAKQI